MRKSALVDLILLAIVFWGVWSLRFLGVENVGLWSMLAGCVVGLGLITVRKQSLKEVGLRVGGGPGWTLARMGEFALVFYFVGAVGIGIATALGYPPQTSSAVSNQPEALSAFLLDIVFGVWIGTALGEELFFRGIVLAKFQMLFGRGPIGAGLAAISQAIWFGAGHASQGLSGMILTGVIGLVFALYFLTRARRSLVPLMLVHGLVNTITLTIAYLIR